MEILYGIITLIVYFLGVATGISIPYFIKKYVSQIKEQVKNDESDVSKKSNPSSLTKEVMNEWFYGGDD